MECTSERLEIVARSIEHSSSYRLIVVCRPAGETGGCLELGMSWKYFNCLCVCAMGCLPKLRCRPVAKRNKPELSSLAR